RTLFQLFQRLLLHGNVLLEDDQLFDGNVLLCRFLLLTLDRLADRLCLLLSVHLLRLLVHLLSSCFALSEHLWLLGFISHRLDRLIAVHSAHPIRILLFNVSRFNGSLFRCHRLLFLVGSVLVSVSLLWLLLLLFALVLPRMATMVVVLALADDNRLFDHFGSSLYKATVEAGLVNLFRQALTLLDDCFRS